MGDKLIVATSRESMYSIIDALLPIETEAMIETEATTTNDSEINALDE